MSDLASMRSTLQERQSNSYFVGILLSVFLFAQQVTMADESESGLEPDRVRIDLSAIGPEDVVADPMTGEITVQLPPAEITYVDIDEAATEVYDRDTGIFVDPDPALEQEARLAAEELLEAKAIEGGVLIEATDRAVSVVTGLAEAFGYTDVTILP